MRHDAATVSWCQPLGSLIWALSCQQPAACWMPLGGSVLDASAAVCEDALMLLQMPVLYGCSSHGSALLVMVSCES